MLNNELNSFSPQVSSEQTPSEQTPSEQVPKSPSKILIVVEVFLLIFVVVLVITFLKQRSNNSQAVTKVNPGTDNNSNFLNENEVTTGDKTPINNNPVTAIDPKLNNSKNINAGKDGDNLHLGAPIPDQSMVVPESAVPNQAVKISGTAKGFEPNQFTTSPGQEITLALTSRIDSPVVLTFYSPKMPATSLGCGAGETRYVTFKAPLDPGEYIFKNDIIGHSSETGKMIVK